jgi:hypothetical protein
MGDFEVGNPAIRQPHALNVHFQNATLEHRP